MLCEAVGCACMLGYLSPKNGGRKREEGLLSEFGIGLEGGRKENDFVGKVRKKRGRRWGDEKRFGSIEISAV